MKTLQQLQCMHLCTGHCCNKRSCTGQDCNNEQSCRYGRSTLQLLLKKAAIKLQIWGGVVVVVVVVRGGAFRSVKCGV